MSNLPPKMFPEDALKDGPPGYVVKADGSGIPHYAPEGGGAGGTNSFHFSQGIASATWDIVHNLGFKPNVTVEDSAHTVIEGAGIDHIDANHLTLTFSAPFSGDAYLS
jgi:hypothetical protein